jgi:hypothetical protein
MFMVLYKSQPFSDDIPARMISSTKSRLLAMTELGKKRMKPTIVYKHYILLQSNKKSTLMYVGGLKSSRPQPQIATLSARFLFLSWYICHKQPCETASNSIK